MCSILHGRLVVPFMLTRKIFVSKLDMWIRREYPTRTRGAGFSWMLSPTEDILTFLLRT